VSTNRTHRNRLARALAAIDGIGYQQALQRVIAAADAGQLPDPLDPAGIRRALDQLAHTNHAEAATTPTALPPRYQRLAQIFPDRLHPGVRERVARAHALGVPALRCRGSYDPAEILGAVTDDPSHLDPGLDTDWWQRVVTAGPRPDCALPDPYPPGSSPDGCLPLDRALDRRDATGDIDAYEQALRAITRREPRDVDAHAHLGNLYLDLADPSSPLVVTPPPDQRQRRAWLRTALGHYQTAVGVAELALPDPFTGVLTWSELDNRPLHRALQGLALTLWRLGRVGTAEQVVHNMLWLDPRNCQNAHALLTEFRSARPSEGAAPQ
jgi:hypothetical protein